MLVLAYNCLLLSSCTFKLAFKWVIVYLSLHCCTESEGGEPGIWKWSLSCSCEKPEDLASNPSRQESIGWYLVNRDFGLWHHLWGSLASYSLSKQFQKSCLNHMWGLVSRTQMFAEQNEKNSVIQVKELRWVGQHCHMLKGRLNGNIHRRMGVWEWSMAVSHICKAGSATQVTEEHTCYSPGVQCVCCV